MQKSVMEKLFFTLLILSVNKFVCEAFSPSSYFEETGGKIHQSSSPTADPEEQAEAVRNLLQNLIPQHARKFIIQVNFNLEPENKSVFQIERRNGTIIIIGNRGYAAASGVHHYLKRYCGCHVSWSGNQLKLPNVLPGPKKPIRKVSNDKYHYYMNVCTFSYSTVWWRWERWEREIDWMALNGINLPLAFTGQELIYKRVFKELNFSDHDVDEFFTGPAFLAWNRMGNVQGWAGPLSDSWLSKQAELQHKILHRMRSFGMTPVLPAFSGRVPPSTPRYFPNASVTYLNKKWGHFDPPYGPVMFLEPTDDLFKKISGMFLKKYSEEFGTDHIYNIDLFNEMPPPSNETSYLKDTGHAVYQSLIASDPQAVWLLQGWMFFSDMDYWTPPRAEAFLTSVPIGRMIVLDLQAELYPQYHRIPSYYGQPFIWCMLHNYGGVLGLYGSMDDVNIGSFEGRNYNGSTMIGTGMTPEGIETNDVMYELMNEMVWRRHPVSIKKWLARYIARRYTTKSRDVLDAWILLYRSVYNATVPYRDHGKYILTRRPALNIESYIWYDPVDVLKAWKYFVKASKKQRLSDSDLFKHDLVDVTRQGLQIVMGILYPSMKKAFEQKKLDDLRNISSQILDLYLDMEKLLATDIRFLLGPWLENAKQWAVNSEERKLYEYNARNQITLWGPSGQILDYAAKQWSGVMTGYYRKRWMLFLQTLETCLRKSTPFKQSKFNKEVLKAVETPFTFASDVYPVEPQGSSIDISRELFAKYSKMLWISKKHHL